MIIKNILIYGNSIYYLVEGIRSATNEHLYQNIWGKNVEQLKMYNQNRLSIVLWQSRDLMSNGKTTFSLLLPIYRLPFCQGRPTLYALYGIIKDI